MNWSYLAAAIPKFAEAAKLTLELSVYGIALSLAVGLPVAVVTAYRIRPFYFLARGYIELSRNTPLLIQLFFLYYGHHRPDIFGCELYGRSIAGGNPLRAERAD